MSQSGSYFKFGALIKGFDSITSVGGTSTLTTSSNVFQIVTGSLPQTVQLPDATLLALNRYFNVISKDTSVITVKNGGGSVIATIGAGGFGTFRATTVGSVGGIWDTSLLDASSGAASATSTDKIDFMQGMADLNYDDGTVITKKLQFNPEEVGGNFWLTKASYPITGGNAASFVLNGFRYLANTYNGSISSTTNRYDDTNNYWLSRQAVGTGLLAPAGFNTGKGYKVGGENISAVPQTTVEQYTDATDSWATMGPFPVASSNAGAFDLGGYGWIVSPAFGTYTKLNYRYDETSDTWLLRNPNLTAVSGDNKCDQYNGFGYTIGGNFSVGTTTADVAKYDISIDTWIAVGSLSVAKRYVYAFASNGFLYSAGGASPTATNTVEEYSDQNNAWRVRAPLNNNNEECHTGKMVVNEVGYVTGGYNGSIYLSTTESYKNFNLFLTGPLKKSLNAPTVILAAANILGVVADLLVQIRTDGDTWKTLSANQDSALKLDEKVKAKFVEAGLGYVAGGDTLSTTYYATSEFYNPTANTWTVRGSLSGNRAGICAFPLNGLGYAAGGFDGATQFNTVQKFDDVLNAFNAATSMTETHVAAASFSLDGYGFVAGGSTTSSITERFDAVTSSWATKASLPTLIQNNSLGSNLNGHGYSSGGFNIVRTNAHSQYSHILDTWVSKAALLAAQDACAGFVLNNFLYKTSGWDTPTVNATDKYNDQTDAWTNTASLGTSRSGCGSFRAEGYGYVAGGDNGGSSFTTTDQYNDVTSVYASKANLNTARSIPGVGFTPGTARVYELRVGLPSFIAGLGAGVWTVKAPLSATRSGCYTFNLNGFLYNASGHTGGVAQSDAYRYDTELNSWRRGADVTVADASSGDSGVTLEGFGYGPGGAVAGGATTTVRKLNGDTEIWSTGTAINRAHLSHGTFSLNGMMYISGGNGAGLVGKFHDQFNPSTNTWTAKTDLTTANKDQNPSESLNGFGYNFGGYDGTNSLAAIDKYDDATDSWVVAGSHTATRRGCGASMFDDRIYIYNGYDSVVTFNSTMEYYSDVSNVWTIGPSMSSAGRYGTSGAQLNSTAFSIGGSSGPYFDAVDQFIPSKNKLVAGVALRVEE